MEEKNLREIINEKKETTNIQSDNDIKQINLNKQKEYLDMQLDRIRKMIEESKPVWILDDFEPFFRMEKTRGLDEVVRNIRIMNYKDAHELLRILKNLSLKKKELSKVHEFIVKYRTGYRYAYVNKNLEYEKIQELIKSWIFYSNTKVTKNKIKFLSDSFFWTRIVGGIGFIIAIIITIILIFAVFFGIIYGIVSIFV